MAGIPFRGIGAWTLFMIVGIQSRPTSTATNPTEREAALERSGDFGGAARALEPLLASAPADAALNAKIGSLWSAAEHYENAEKFLSKAVEIAPGERNYWLSLGEARIRGQQFHPAMEAFLRAEKIDDSDGKAGNGIGACYFSLGDRDSAKQYLQRAAARNARMIGPRHLLGRIALDEGLFDSAIQQFKECLQLDPRDSESQFRLGLAFRRAGSPEEAERAFRAAIAEDPLHLGARMNLGQVLNLMKRDSEGLAEIEAHGKVARNKQILTFATASLRLDPSDAHSRAVVGSALLNLELYGEALAQFREALRSKKAPVSALVGAARACAGLGEHNAQLQYAQKALTVLENDPRATAGELELVRGLIAAASSKPSK